jgi:hypothetical protein
MLIKSTLQLIILCSILLTGCVIPGARQERAALELQSNDSLFVVDQGDFHFRIILPKDLMIANEPALALSNDDTKLHITCGSDFRLIVEKNTEKKRTLPSKDGIFHYDILDEEFDSSIFKRVLPDGRTYDYGIFQATSVGTAHYLFQSDTEGEYDLQDALRMQSALASIRK